MKHMPFVFLLLVLISCGPSRDKSVREMTDLENSLFSLQSMGFDTAKAKILMGKYEDFVLKRPGDSLSPECLFNAANLALNLGDGTKALALFDRFIQTFPDHPKAEISLFFRGFVYENYLRDLGKAKEVYTLFIGKYPGSNFADDAAMALLNLGKTPDEMFREFEAKRRADSARMADSLAMAGKTKAARKGR
jgi:outer membrane protein assembly factor BamD (BamD/ComL family)